MKKNEHAIGLMKEKRKFYQERQSFHYRSFAAFALILLLDFIIIIYTRAITLDAYAWAGIIFLFVLLSVEGIQYKKFKELKQSVDDLYLRGEYVGSKE